METRKASYASLANIISRFVTHSLDLEGTILHAMLQSLVQTKPDVFIDSKTDYLESALKSLTTGLDDYSTDQRGDVGSWIRMTCAASLAQVITSLSPVSIWSDRSLKLLEIAIQFLAKQSVEKLDNVRVAAGVALEKILLHIKEAGTIPDRWEDISRIVLV